MFHLLALLPVVAATVQESGPPAPPAAHAAPAVAPTTDAGPGYKVMQTFAVGGEGGWDYLSVDAEARRLYVPRSNRVLVLDADTGARVGEITDTAGVHGVALAASLGRGFTSNGRADTATVFDLKTLKVLETVKTGKNPDALLFEPMHERVYIGNGRSNDVTVIDAEELTVLGTVPVGGKPEAMVADAKGNVFVNSESTSEIVRIEATKLVVDKRYALAPGTDPTGLAFDAEHGTLFAACSNEYLVVVDAAAGKVLTSAKIGRRTDGAAFDPSSGFAFSSNGEGTISVVATTGDKPFTVVQTLPTAAGARTIALDTKTHHLYLPTAEYEAAQPADGGQRRRPAMKPDSFKIIVVGR